MYLLLFGETQQSKRLQQSLEYPVVFSDVRQVVCTTCKHKNTNRARTNKLLQATTGSHQEFPLDESTRKEHCYSDNMAEITMLKINTYYDILNKSKTGLRSSHSYIDYLLCPASYLCLCVCLCICSSPSLTSLLPVWRFNLT